MGRLYAWWSIIGKYDRGVFSSSTLLLQVVPHSAKEEFPIEV
jgi:hypothetical protein